MDFPPCSGRGSCPIEVRLICCRRGVVPAKRGIRMTALTVSYDVLDQVSERMHSAAGSFVRGSVDGATGAFGAAEVDQAFAMMRAMQQQMAQWLSDSAMTLDLCP